MKVQIYAKALAGACTRYQEALIKELMAPYSITITTGWWIWRKTETQIVSRTATEAKIWAEANNPLFWKSRLLLAISMHKRPETLFDITDDELSAIAAWLSEFEPERI